MSQTENTEANSERIRKIYAKDVKVGEVIHTVFRAIFKEKHQSRGGKPYLSLLLVDRTGEIDGRVFDNVGAADQAFSNEDYLLVKGKAGTFHGKTQLVIDQLERLDPGPIDAAEFAYTPAPPPSKNAEKPEKHGSEKEHHEQRVRLSKRLERLLQNPQLAQALDTFVAHLEKAFAAEHGTPLPPKPERPPRPPKPPRGDKPAHTRESSGPKVEHKPAGPSRDPNLPEGLAFKPFTALVPGEKPAESAPPAPATTPETPTP
ncbi:MAG: hypothetical protein JNM17_04725 [Archangium sp.]|nr:hypothetical protein [Archangium sp.]